MSAITFENVTLRLNGYTVLDKVSFDVEPGAFVGVFGTNGSGKTTLFRAVTGNIKPSKGRIRIFNQSIRKNRSLLGYMPQYRTIAGINLNGRTYVSLAIKGEKWGFPILSRKEKKEIDDILELVDASELASRPLSSMSGGERQRLFLAQALIIKPQLLLLDEPLNNLDPNRAQELIHLIKVIQKQRKMTVMCSSHDINSLLQGMDKVLYLGKTSAKIGTVDEILTSDALSDLYKMPIKVLRIDGRIFITTGAYTMGLSDGCCHTGQISDCV